jgi:hypothetical protein
MDELEGFRTLIPELTAIACRRGIDVATVSRKNGLWRNGRILTFWPEAGVIRYCLQGGIKELPNAFAGSAGAFHGGYTEAGDCANLEDAMDLLVAWLFEERDVDHLPKRVVRKCGIG